MKLDAQIHGYLQGHQLLEATATLSKIDQSVIDRLSDVAGPLRPGEKFEPYLSAYPLPSGERFVIARTWQDFTVPRAGCVRTLSLIIPSDAWAEASSLGGLLRKLETPTLPVPADLFTDTNEEGWPLPPAPPFRSHELLEALFLEDAKPIAIFDCPEPDLVAMRLLSAFWPALRSSFSLSTFALSPRKLEGKNFDLVFAPKDVRSRFTDWPGRRIDARSGAQPRHRWTGTVVDRVFNDPKPWLLDSREMRLFGSGDTQVRAALRVALRWEELLEKLDQTPTAALGLLDIASSRMHADPDEITALEPALAGAARKGIELLPASEAWALLGAMAKKTHDTPLGSVVVAVAKAAGDLAEKDPSGAVSLLDQADVSAAIDALTTGISMSLEKKFSDRTVEALLASRPDTLVRLLASNPALAGPVMTRPTLIQRVGGIIPQLSDGARAIVVPALLRHATDNLHLPVAASIIASMTSSELADEVRFLNNANGLGSEALFWPIVERARVLRALDEIREASLDGSDSPGRDAFLKTTLSPTPADISWILRQPKLSSAAASEVLVQLLSLASPDQLRELFGGHLSLELSNRLVGPAPDILRRALLEAPLPLSQAVALTVKVAPTSRADVRSQLLFRVLDRCFVEHFEGDEIASVAEFMNLLGPAMDARWAVTRALSKAVGNSLITRNLRAFGRVSDAVKKRIIAVIDEGAQLLSERYVLEIDEPAATDLANLLSKAPPGELFRASGRLLPVVLRTRKAPVSSLIAVTFPVIYRELAKEDDGPDLLRFMPFFDWDRCKAARRELVDAFIASPPWSPADLALTACRTPDFSKIMRRMAKAYGGEAYINRLSSVVNTLPDGCRKKTVSLIADIRSNWSSKYSWND